MADPCVYCGAKADGLDHIRPRSRGGSDYWTNRAPACRDCDNAKGNTDLVLFLLIEGWATNKLRRRHYRLEGVKKAACYMLRQRIALEFYRGNVRFTETGRVGFRANVGKTQTDDARSSCSNHPDGGDRVAGIGSKS
jgi:hypothetical protein